MRITEIRALTRSRFQITVEGQLTFVLYKGELSRYGIENDSDLGETAVAEIMGQVLPLRAKKYAMNLLVKRDYPEGELKEKLKKAGYPDEIAEEALSYVKSYGYVDDVSYAKKYVETYQDREGRRQLAWKLRQKGIDRQIIEEALDAYMTEDSQEVIRRLIEKKMGNRLEMTDKDRRSLVGFLGRRGFSSEEIFTALREYEA